MPIRDSYYNKGLDELESRVESNSGAKNDVAIQRNRLRENLDIERRDGSSENNRKERNEIIGALNHLAMKHCQGKTFIDLCESHVGHTMADTKILSGVRSLVREKIGEPENRHLLELRKKKETSFVRRGDEEGRTYREPEGKVEETPLVEIFNEYPRMLILSEAGHGKTTELYRLAEQLCDRAEKDPKEPVPIILSLASSERNNAAQERSEGERQNFHSVSIRQWVSKKLSDYPDYNLSASDNGGWNPDTTFGCSRIIALPLPLVRHLLSQQERGKGGEGQRVCVSTRRWYEDTILLLDGLDEVPPDQRAACIKAINDFRKAEGPAGLVVTCREEVYKKLLDQGGKLELQAAIILQPLDWEQIETHLQARKQDHLLSRFAEDSSLCELANNPLMFWVIREAFPESSGDARDNGLAGATLEERRQELFTRYIRRTLEGCSSSFRPEHLLSGIRMLASGMVQEHLSVFRPNQIALSWLPPTMQRSHRFLSGLAANVMKFLIGLLIGVFVWFVLALFPTPDAWSSGVKAFITVVPFIASITVLFIGLHRIANIGNVDFASTAPTNGSQQHWLLRESNFGGWPHFLLGSVAGFSGLLPGLIAPETSIFYGVAVVVGAGLVWPVLLFLHAKVFSPLPDTQTGSHLREEPSPEVEHTLANTDIRVLLLILLFASITITFLAFNGWLISPELGIQSLFCLLALSIVLLNALLKELEPRLNHRLLLALAASVVDRGGDENHSPSPTMLFSLLLSGSKQVRRYNNVLHTLCKCKFLQPSTKVADQGEAYEFRHLLFREYFAALKDDDIEKIVSCIQKHQRS